MVSDASRSRAGFHWVWKKRRRVPNAVRHTGCKLTYSVAGSLHERVAGQLLEIPVVDVVKLVLRQPKRVENLDGLADVARTFFRIERTVGGEQNTLVRIELKSAQRCPAAAERR